ncbi:MAG TPA: crosslink repair DNA glycosylase YcaQ family protein, partial [Actinomycetota bacterium]
ADEVGQAPDLPVPPTRCPVRLTGGFDALLLGYADRSLHLAPEHARRVNTGGGLVKPVVLDDGVVVATWRYLRGASDTIEVAPFQPLAGRAVRGIEREVGEIGAFLGRDPHLDLVEVAPS